MYIILSIYFFMPWYEGGLPLDRDVNTCVSSSPHPLKTYVYIVEA